MTTAVAQQRRIQHPHPPWQGIGVVGVMRAASTVVLGCFRARNLDKSGKSEITLTRLLQEGKLVSTMTAVAQRRIQHLNPPWQGIGIVGVMRAASCLVLGCFRARKLGKSD